MFTCFCRECKKVIEKDEFDYEIDLVEAPWEGDWEHVHLKCGSIVSWI
ncbi:hypothetical protein [Bacillus amyloliquefaciens]|nr:hypothetical protein [Bacillus amyloliquefaciens]